MNARLFVGNLSPRTSEEQLRRFFSSVGSLTSVNLPLDRKTRRPRGFGFVEFSEPEEAERALATLDQHVLDGRKVDLSWARAREPTDLSPRPRGPRQPVYRLAKSEDFEDYTGYWENQRPRSADDYARKRPSKPLGHGKHGSDRVRGRGNRRRLE